MSPFRQVAEKRVPHQVLLMRWAPRRDLVALANNAGEVTLHRLSNFQRVWRLAPQEPTGTVVTALAWRPDGKVLAVGYGDTGQLVLCDVEKAAILYSTTSLRDISCMHWVDVAERRRSEFHVYEDDHTMYLPKLPPLPKSGYTYSDKVFGEESSDDISKLLGQCRLNILVLGNDHSAVAFYAYGIFKIAELSTPKPGRVKELCLSDNLEALSAIVELCTENEACLVTYLQWDTSLLSTCLQEITKVARTFTHISALLQYHQLTIQSMSGAIDDVLLEMDTGLTKYVEANKDICVSHELLELLLCGTARDSMVMLLANKLTVKGLKKLCQAMQSSYTSILKLLTGHLQSAAEALLYRLSELQGMARWRQQYQSLGLDEEAIEDATQAVGSYILKSNELLHVIENSLKNFRAFSYWLYNVILTLSDETIPPENSKMSQKDVMLVANFIEEHFGPKKNDYEKSGKYFSVERVSQYLKDEDLDMPQDLSQNSWCSFVENSQPLTESPLLCRCHHKSSLCQMRSLMDAKVRACLHKPAVTVGKSLCTHVQWTLFKHPGRKGNPYCLSMWSNEHSALQMTLFSLGPSPADVIYLMETNTAFTKLEVIVLDAQFYDQDTVTMLLRGHFDGEEDQARALTQVSIVPTDGETSPTMPNGTPTASQPSSSFNEQACIISDVNVPLNEISIDDWRTLKNMDACSVAVNGQRSVACVMSNSRQHVRLYEMDAEEEESGELDETADGSDITMDMIPAQLDSNLPRPESESDSKL